MVARRIRVAVVAAAMIAWGLATVAPSAAQRAADEAEREYRLGYQALQAGDCVEALAHYRRSFELTPRPRTVFNIAVCEEELGLHADAWRSYHLFLELAEPRDAKIVARARARIAALRGVLRGKVTVRSSPPGAAVHVDGERDARGVTPLTVALEPGPHTIRVVASDTIPVERSVEVAPDAVEVVAVTLALPSTIRVVADPPDASIEREGGAAPSTGTYEAAVAPGRHVITVRRDGYVSERLEIDAVAGRTHVERVRLRPLPSVATLVIEGVRDASVSVDGVVTPASRTTTGALAMRGVPAGNRAVEVTAAGRAAWRDELHLSPGEVVTVSVDAPPVSSKRRALAWGLGGLGGASVVGGGVLGVLALRDVASPSVDIHDRGKDRALLADGLVVVGTIAVVVAWRLLRDRAPSATITRTYEGAR